jgi:hypothetical protein
LASLPLMSLAWVVSLLAKLSASKPVSPVAVTAKLAVDAAEPHAAKAIATPHKASVDRLLIKNPLRPARSRS